jgi:hypothetical protein
MNQFYPTAPYWFAVLPTILLAFGVLGWLAWSRWLSHRETMRAAELGGNSRVALALRERWRARHGVLWAVRVLALGVGLVVVAVFADKWETFVVEGGEEDTAAVAVDVERASGEEGDNARRRHEYAPAERRVVRRVPEAEQMLLLIGAAISLLLVGAVTLIAYAIWSRRDVEVLALGLLGDKTKVAPDAGEEGEGQSETRGDAGGERSE